MLRTTGRPPAPVALHPFDLTVVTVRPGVCHDAVYLGASARYRYYLTVLGVRRTRRG